MDVVTRLKEVLRPFEPWLPSRASRLSWSQSLRTLQDQGFRPRTVFDVGVGFGTFGLYHLFPDAFFHLIEPTPESLPHMQRIARRLACRIHPLALGDRDGEAVLEIRADIQGSTLLDPGLDPAGGSQIAMPCGPGNAPRLAEASDQDCQSSISRWPTL
jgi:hypothetical protein